MAHHLSHTAVGAACKNFLWYYGLPVGLLFMKIVGCQVIFLLLLF
jgi:hypothetical protein